MKSTTSPASIDHRGSSARIHGSVAQEIGVAIVSGRLQPGEILEGEIEASERRKVSRSAYREAIRMLAAKGLVESRPKAGTRVTPPERWNLLDPDVLGWIFATEPSAAFIRDLFELRLIVEPAAADLAARRRTSSDLAVMGHALEEMAHHGLTVEKGRAADQAFHHAILQAARNAPLLSLSSSIGAAVSWTTIFKQRRRRLPRDPLPDHRALFDAIVASDPVAARERMVDLVQMALEDTETSLAD